MKHILNEDNIEKVQRDLANIQRDIKNTLLKYKTASPDKKQKYIEDLKKLQDKKKKLNADMEDEIAKLHADVELADLDEAFHYINKNDLKRLSYIIESLVYDLKNKLPSYKIKRIINNQINEILNKSKINNIK